MTIQRWLALGLMGVLVLTCQGRALAEEGAPSKASLEAMGLSGLSIMSDDEAINIRGEGFGSGGSSASASGSSFANIETPFGSAGSENSYDAHGKHSASGDNLSFAGVEITTSGGNDGEHHGKPPKNGGMDGKPSHGKDHGDKGGNGGMGGDKHGKDHGDKGGNSRCGGMGGDKHGKGGKGNGGGGGGAPKTVSFTVFAGGSSHAHAH
jgi:hypothetical protein